MFKQQMVKNIAKQAFIDAVVYLSLIEVLEGGNGNGASEAINKAGAGWAGLHVQNSLFFRLHIIVARHYLPVRDKSDLHAAKAFELLKNADVRAGVVSATQGERLTEAEARWKACCDDPRLDAYIQLRHKQLAHLAEPKEGFTPPMYGDVIEIARNTAQCFNALANGVGIVSLEIETQIVAQKKSATAFWAPWVKA